MTESGITSSPVATAPPPFVGRRKQLDWLAACLRDALAGRPQLILTPGEPGIGKTRLLRELTSIAEQADARVAFGRCHEDLALPYLPFAEPLFARLLEADAETTPAADAEVIRQVLHAGAQSMTGDSLQADQDKLQLFLAVSRATIRLAQQRPLVVIVDDLHWADRASLGLFSHLVFAVADAMGNERVPLMLVGTFRPVEADEPLARTVARLQREAICRTLDLPGLSEAEVDQLVGGLGLLRPAPPLVAALSKLSRGNPLFIQEIVHHLVKQGALRQQGGELVNVVALDEMHLPGEVTQAIAARTHGLGEGSREVLTLAALLGERCTLPVLAATSGVGEAQLLTILEDAIDQRLLTNDGNAFQFAHPLIRHVLATAPSAARRQRMHAQIARVLERLYAARVDEHVVEIAHHLIAAGPVAAAAQVVEYGRRAGDHALAVFAWDEAARCYAAALSAAEAGAGIGVHERAELHYRAGLAHFRDWDAGPCVQQYDKAIAAYRASGDIAGWARALREAMRARITLANVPYGTLIDTRPLEDALQALGDSEPALRGRIWATMSQVYWTAREPDRATEMARRALQIGHDTGDDRLCAEANAGLALALTGAMRVNDALESYHAALADAQRVSDPWLQSWPRQRIPGMLCRLGRLTEAREAAATAAELAHKTHDWGYSLCLAARAYLATATGDFDAAERDAREVMMMVRRSRYPWGGAEVLPVLACARALRGAWAEAYDAIDLLTEPGEVFEEPGPSVQLGGWVYKLLLQTHAALAGVTTKPLAGNGLRLQPDPSPDIYSLFALCAVVETADRTGEAKLATSVSPALTTALQRGVLFSSGWVFLLPRILGVAASLERQWDVAQPHFEHAIAAAIAAGANPEQGRTQLDYARMLAARDAPGDRPHAVELLTAATNLFYDLHMVPFVARAADLARRLHVALPLPPPGAPAPDQPTRFEAEILLLLGNDRTDEEIGDELLLRPATVVHRIDGLLGKIGVADRSAAAAYAVERGNELQRLAAGEPATRVAPAGPSSPRAAQHPIVILFSDVAGSTALIDRLGDTSARVLLLEHDHIIRDCLATHGGTRIKHTGDGVFASFTSAVAAIECATAIQRALAQHNAKHPDTPVRVRMGLNAGEPIIEAGELFGAAVNAAARICDRARPGQILVSDVVYQLADGKGISFTERGRVALKGFSKRFRLYAVDWDTLSSTGST